jgi:hypothetical protein
MTSAYQQKNVDAKPKTHAIFSEKYLSLWMNSFHQTKKKEIVAVKPLSLTVKALVVAVSKQKRPPMQNALAVFCNYPS